MSPVDPTLLVGAWLWEKFGGKVVERAGTRLGDSARTRWTKFSWKDAAERYRQEMQRLYGTLRIIGMAEPVALANIFTDVHILDKPSAWRRYDIEELARQQLLDETSTKHMERYDALAIVERHERLMILGKPGAGKSTLLKHLVLQATTGKLDAVPIFVPLKAWSDCGLALMPFLAQQFAICAFPDAQPFIEDILSEGHAMVLFDGLDEVNLEQHARERITREVRDFADQYARSRCVITCRTAATDHQFEQFTYCELADFTKEQARTLIGNWFQRDEAKRTAFLEEFAKPDHAPLRDLARTPLLLALLCITFDETMHFLPRRVEIYEEALDALLKKWDSSRSIRRDEIYRKLSLGRKRELLTRIAAATFEDGKLFMRQDDLVRQILQYLHHLPPADVTEEIDGEVILRSIEAQHGLLIERAHRIYSFSHLTFHEYFTARNIAEHPSPEMFRQAVTHAQDPRWREVLLLTVSMLDETNAVVFFDAFDTRLRKITQADRVLLALLQWIQRKAKGVASVQQLDMHITYLTLALTTMAISRLHDPDLTRADAFDLVRALAHTRAHALALAHALDHTLDRDLDHTLDRARVLVRDFALDRALDLDLGHELALALARVAQSQPHKQVQSDFLWSSILILIRLAAISEPAGRMRIADDLLKLWPTQVTLAPPALHTTLSFLILPASDTLAEDWERFEIGVRAALREHLDIGHFWSPDNAQLRHLATYLEISRRLLECLDLAAVPDREAIRNRVLLPPEE